eukprot:scaffold5239_cov66-Phaeocystis_antarctica.AAC.1
MADGLLEAVRGLWLTHPDLGPKPLLAKLREQQADLGAGTREVREALTALKAELEAESEATEAAAAPPAAATPPAADAPPAADEGSVPSGVALSLACFGCARLPSEMGDDRVKHPVCPKCVKLKVPTTYWCCVNCPGNPGAWKRHAGYHKQLKGFRTRTEDGGVAQQQNREAAERAARYAARTGDEYMELVAEGARYLSKEDTRRAARAFREAIALRPDRPEAYASLGVSLNNSAHYAEAAQRLLEATERYPVDSEVWAQATAVAFEKLMLKACAEVAKPEWWNDDGLKALSARVVRAAADDGQANQMRALVLSGHCDVWEAGPRSPAELEEAATHYERAAALHPTPAGKAALAGQAVRCRRQAEAFAPANYSPSSRSAKSLHDAHRRPRGPGGLRGPQGKKMVSGNGTSLNAGQTRTLPAHLRYAKLSADLPEPEKRTPSQLAAELKGTVQLPVALKRPQVIELLNMSEYTHNVESVVPLDEPLFQPTPPEVVFEAFEPLQKYTALLSLRNNDNVNRRIKIITPDSSVFSIEPPKVLKGSGGGK